jgi:membrane-bound serine protease (ClpP class)
VLRISYLTAFWLVSLAVILTLGHVALARQDGEPRLGFLGFNAPYEGKVGPSVLMIRVEGVIDTAMEDYIANAIAKAEEMNVPLVILLNTPGGLLDSAMNIVWSIDKSKVPVIGFVSEGWAMSAGTMILVSTHIAAMAPGTQIGSMQPIGYNPATGTYEPINESKVINAILEFLDQHAVSKGRNQTAIHRFVTENLNLGPDEALKYHVIEFVAKDLNDLISQINGAVVRTSAGDVKLELDGSYIEYKPGLRIVLLHALSDPIVSSILLSLGTLIILFTLASGHAAFTPIGVLLLLLGLAGTGFNPNITAIALLVIGAILVLIEIYTPGFGIIGGTGIAMLVIGVALMPVASEGFTVTVEYANKFLYTVYAIGGLVGGFTALAVYKVIQVRKRKPVTWTIEGARGKALDLISPDKPGFVIVEGEYWKAVSDEPIKPGTEVVVIEKIGTMLRVKPARSPREGTA